MQDKPSAKTASVHQTAHLCGMPLNHKLAFSPQESESVQTIKNIPVQMQLPSGKKLINNY